MSYPSLKDLQRVLPQHYRRWVRGGLLAAALGYAAVATTKPGPLLQTAEFWVGALCLALFSFERHAPKTASYLGLLVIWWELIWSLAENDEGLRSTSVVALPVWIVVVALFLGRRAAWTSTAVTVAAIPLSTHVFWPLLHPNRTLDVPADLLIVSEICIVSVAWLVTQFMGTLIESLRRERLNSSRTAQLVENAPDAMIGVSEGRVVAFNALSEKYFGVSREEMLGRPLSDLPFWSPGSDKALEEAREAPRDLTLGEVVLETRVQILTHEGASREELYVFRDVTERHLAEEKARDLQTQLEHAQRLEAIGQLAGGIAHDFNNLLTAFSGTAEILLDSEDEEVRELAAELDSATNRGAALTRQLLTFARRDVVQSKVLDLSRVIESSRTLLEHLLGERMTLDLDLADDCLIEGDQAQIEQIILNLAANARDATQTSGTLTLITSRKAERVLLLARDDGEGMDEPTAARIFEPFFTTKPREKGTGLGLSTVHGIVTRSGGTIEVDSSLGEGTTFTISFPRAERQHEDHESVQRISRKMPMHGHLLLVEDNDAARDITERLLRRSGFQVTSASSAEEALTLCRDGLEPDALVSDVVMRGLTGVELAARLRDKTPDLPVLFVSGYVDDVLRDWPFNTTEDLLLKPFSGDMLIERIATKLGARASRLRVVGDEHGGS